MTETTRPSDIGMYIPVRNAARTIAATVESIRNQTLRPSELVLVVDARSGDHTLEVCRSLGVRMIEQTGGTLGRARNLGIAALSTPWIASCDADVTLTPTWLEHLAGHHTRPYAGIGGCTFEKIITDGDQWRAANLPHNWGEAELINPFMLVSEVMFRRRALLSVGGYREDLNYNEDSELCRRLRDAGHDLLYTPEAVAWHIRADGVLDVLNLRWKYAEARQAALLERFEGLIRKLAVNRDYAVSTLAKLIAEQREPISYISFLLYSHHALLDLKALLRGRALIPPEERAALLGSLYDVILEGIDSVCPELADSVGFDLADLVPNYGDRTVVNPPPRWNSYLDEIRDACREYVGRFDAETLGIFQQSANYLHGELPAEKVATHSRMDEVRIGLLLTALPPAPFVTREMVDRWRLDFPHCERAVLLGDHDPGDAALLGGKFTVAALPMSETEKVDQGSLVVVPNLQRDARPLARLREIAGRAGIAVIAYSTPSSFLPGLDALQARQLASTASQAGLYVARFDTLVGRTVLTLQSTPPAAGSTSETDHRSVARS